MEEDKKAIKPISNRRKIESDEKDMINRLGRQITRQVLRNIIAGYYNK